MSGLYATILLRRPFEPADTGSVTAILKSVVEHVEESRKGRHWDFTVDRGSGTVDVRPMDFNTDDYDSLLVEYNLLVEDAPEIVELAFGCRRACDKETCEALQTAFTRAFDGIDCGMRY